MLALYVTLATLVNDGTDKVLDRIEQKRRSEEGATAVEYGLMVALIAVAIIVVVTTLGKQLRDLFQRVSDKLGAA